MPAAPAAPKHREQHVRAGQHREMQAPVRETRKHCVVRQPRAVQEKERHDRSLDQHVQRLGGLARGRQ